MKTLPNSNMIWRGFGWLLLIMAMCHLGVAGVYAQSPAPGQIAERIRATLVQIQVNAANLATAQDQLAALRREYSLLATTIARYAPTADAAAQRGFDAAEQALAAADLPRFAAARAEIWTALLNGGYAVVTGALQAGDAATAQQWLPVREFRHANRFARPNADATKAVRAAVTGDLAPATALAAVKADLLDTYQARLAEALATIAIADQQGFTTRRAEAAALAAGYFAILLPAYTEQRGAAAATTAQAIFAELQQAALRGAPISLPLAQAQEALRNFRAAPLSPAEQVRRSGQMLRFLQLVPIEYERGVRNGQVTIDLEIREAITFHAGALAAFTDLRDLLEQRDAALATTIADRFAELGTMLANAGNRSAIADPTTIRTTTEALLTDLRKLLPPEWQKQDSGADFDVIRSALDQMENAVRAGEYALAESARLEAYAIMEIGPEAKLIAFAPQYKPIIEGYFWYGQNEHKGLAYLIERQAPPAEIAATRAALDRVLAEAEQALAGSNAPLAITTNAAVIVFREGLEAVLILASLMGSLKTPAQRRFRQPLWFGAGLAMLATVLTWLLAQGALMAMARFGETLEAIVSLIAIAVLLLITNWFFHDVYWKDWMASFHQQKKHILGSQTGQWLGLIMLGFASIYREGFETVLFLQALTLEGTITVVLLGVGIGLALTLLVGLAVFVMQAKLPHKKMLIATGILIGAVLLQMVGHTVNVLQVIGWLPIHPIRWLELPYWTGFWFGLYPTWEGIGLQAAAAIFVIGSYYLAEYMQRRERQHYALAG
ncbi:FTR1 family protein [Chloroflexus sp.]|uniref:FTR1 family protein n=1 Tax=Chloroflexus sp. TaxID=1904827 RepID=UPI00298EDD27|nr:FTR1 family protein [Chloroflexus sp.]MCS6888252.1 FTR1 family protein [Chloroflexus sp.]MDW8402688.1 FTR1 family protein [Chloroflexus sp.]